MDFFSYLCNRKRNQDYPMTQAELHYYESVPRSLASIAQSLATIAKFCEAQMPKKDTNTTDKTKE